MCLLLCVLYYSKYEWVAPLRDKKEITIINTFQKFLNEFWRKSNKIWVVNFTFEIKSWLQDNDIEMYSMHKEGKSVVAEIFIKP